MKKKISKTVDQTEDDFLKVIIEAIQEKKGKAIVTIDLRELDQTICDYFVICHGDSTTHVKAIADSVEEMVEVKAQIRARKKEGMDNAEWVLVDFFNVIVHVFQKDVRSFYKLEELWSDGIHESIKEV